MNVNFKFQNHFFVPTFKIDYLKNKVLFPLGQPVKIAVLTDDHCPKIQPVIRFFVPAHRPV